MPKKIEMNKIKEAAAAIRQELNHIHWGKLIAGVVILIGISYGIVWLLNRYASNLPLPIHSYAWLAYFVVFVCMLIVNLTIIAPLPIGISVMIAVAAAWNPVLAALFASLGATIGELSGYLAGYLGRKVSLSSENSRLQGKVHEWVSRWGATIIFLLSLQPVLPFDIAGLAGGAVKMPVHKFLLACFLGRFIKYILYAYFGASLIKYLPFISF